MNKLLKYRADYIDFTPKFIHTNIENYRAREMIWWAILNISIR